MQRTVWKRKFPRRNSPVEAIVLAIIILLFALGGYHLVQQLNPGTTITPRTVGKLDEVPLLIRHDDSIWSLAFSPQPQADVNFVSSSQDGLIKLWHLDKGAVIEQFAVQAGRNIALSPDGKLLASLGLENGAQVWNLEQFTRLFRRLKDDQEAYAVSFSPDGRILASGRVDGTIKLWDWQRRKLLRTLKAGEAGVLAVAFSPDGQILASGNGRQTQLWNWQTGKVVRTLPEGIGGEAIAFSPNGEIFASAATDGKTQTITLLDWRTGKVLQTLRVAFSNYGTGIAFSPDSQILASGSDEGIQLWDWRSGKAMLTIPEGRERFVFSPDGQTLASNSDSGRIKLWNWRDGRLIREFQSRAKNGYNLRFSADGQTLISDTGGKITLWNQQDGTERFSITFDANINYFSAIAVSPDGQTLAIGSPDKDIKLLRLDDPGKLARPLKAKRENGRFVAFSPNQQDVIIGNVKRIQRLRLKDGQPILTINEAASEGFYAFKLSPNGQTVAGAEFNGAIKLWNLQDGKLIRTLQPDSNTFLSAIAFSPDGQLVAGSFLNKNLVQIWNVRTGNLVHQWDVNRASHVVFSPDGQLLAIGTGAGEVQLWHLRTGKKLRTLKGHASWTGAMAFSPDGQTHIPQVLA